MTGALASIVPQNEARAIRVKGIVQGVGFRPNVWRLAQECGLVGRVLNDGAGVLIEAAGDAQALDLFCARIESEKPPLARIESIEWVYLAKPMAMEGFHIAPSVAGETHTPVTPDAALCQACRAEILNPFERRYRYPFTNCTHCGPRFSIVNGVPYDRALTTMAAFPTCADCAREYSNPADRRFHAQPIACHVCGPKARLERLDGRAMSFDQHSMLDDVDAVAGLIEKGEIVAIKGIGGFHLACDATNAETVRRLRARKRRHGKPFALMARDLDVIRRFCAVSDQEAALLGSAEAPIVLLQADGPERLPEDVAPGLDALGFMLPYTPLHLLILRRLKRPIVMTSGNVSDEPQVTDDAEAREKLAGMADYALFHDRAIANRVDDSVVRMMAGSPRVLRRARGYAPAPIALPKGFEHAPDLLAYGGQLKATFCLVKDGAAILSQHQGDLEEETAFEDYRKNLALYAALFDHAPRLLASDAHPNYSSTKLARERAASDRLPLLEIQHHHAHVASCMAENGLPLDAPPILGLALDGSGFGEDGTIWGGEFLLADYRGFERLGTFKPVALPGGEQAIREPWRNTYAHLMAEIGWTRFAMNYEELDLFSFLNAKPRETLDQMLKRGINSPLAGSCGRLFDAVAAAVGLHREQASYEGQGAMALEAAVCPRALREESEESAYPFSIPRLGGVGLPYVEPLGMWQALLGDLILETPIPIMAARFHQGLAKTLVEMAAKLARDPNGDGRLTETVALSGGCFQNKILLEETSRRLAAQGFQVLTHARIPANDGGIAFGQAAVAAARALAGRGE